jgi:hypothetical protein
MGLAEAVAEGPGVMSGWRDLNSRPLDPQIGGLVVSCDPELRFKDCGGR